VLLSREVSDTTRVLVREALPPKVLGQLLYTNKKKPGMHRACCAAMTRLGLEAAPAEPDP